MADTPTPLSPLQRDVAVDTIAPEGAPETAFCALGGGGGTCTDAQEPNEGRAAAKAVGIGTIAGLQICAGDSDWFAVSGARTVKIYGYSGATNGYTLIVQ